MAYSIGINENINSPEGVTLDHQVALRTWWTLYSLESELCLEYGRPLSIRETDAKASYPTEYPVSSFNSLERAPSLIKKQDAEAKSASKKTFIIVMAKFSRVVRKIIDLASNINERTDALQSFVGRMMNHQAELMTWRAELPVHLAPNDTGTVEGLRAWGQVPWMQHQCLDIELRFNHVMLVMHRPFFANVTFSTPFYSSVMARSVCIGAARETILLVHKVLEDPCKQRSCYYHRVLAATLVVIASAFDSSGDERINLGDLCSQSAEIFSRMRFGCPAKGLELVRMLIHLFQLSHAEIQSVEI
ncbi:hypothetical protein N7448_003335 [Penicillium atrosanguineum]|uniref:Xylanolytic transcriptional activator regulatory domain-containing protein n=1 Tax=Penicillium atrosanguineum TaxID=1132637 RepID=A0A9W9U3P2_9EURO|nr:uncharacterized protein N7443_002304 [Penicillium atrosanguineum]KAJ5122203.1 hypothetical protein N7526_009140 [Penicillium atrosanguineum]KAJ5139927.1 hypothetical protein N7448_003335 [Penicillium atrosanguineum]KAJ5309843.1 hypothetical protein N7443_002304 [Penicillium atrosanguineum]KAJ5315362.1 hypothetical protein N7476_005669 [Penicillium atrosanguineum]